jgi:plastocyanin
VKFNTWLARMAAGVGVCVVLVGCGGAASGSGAASNGGAASEGGAAPSGNAATVAVSATDFAFAFDPAEVPSGLVTFNIKNDGATVHDFAIQGKGVDEKTTYLQAGREASLTVDLAPGTYDYLCTVPTHKELGMLGTLTVK